MNYKFQVLESEGADPEEYIFTEIGSPAMKKPKTGNKKNYNRILLWLNANLRTGFQKRKFGVKPGTFDFKNM